MKQIKALVHRHRIGAVIEALKASAAARNVNVAAVQSLLPAVDAREQHYSVELGEAVIQEYKLEVLCEDESAEVLAMAIADASRTGQDEAAWVYIMDVARAVQVGRG